MKCRIVIDTPCGRDHSLRRQRSSDQGTSPLHQDDISPSTMMKADPFPQADDAKSGTCV
jgi:hypothetical protein